MLTVKIDLGNDAWRDPHDNDALDFSAVAEALINIADTISEAQAGCSGSVMDLSGNTCGSWSLGDA